MRNGMFLQEVDALIGKVSQGKFKWFLQCLIKSADISEGIERNLVICTDEEWDIKDLKSAIDGKQATPEQVIRMANSCRGYLSVKIWFAFFCYLVKLFLLVCVEDNH